MQKKLHTNNRISFNKKVQRNNNKNLNKKNKLLNNTGFNNKKNNVQNSHIINPPSIEIQLTQTEPNLKNINALSISKLPKNIKNQKIKDNTFISKLIKKNSNKNLSGNNLKKHLSNNKKREKSIKTSNIMTLFNTFNKKQFETLKLFTKNKYKNLKKDVIPYISNNSRTTEQKKNKSLSKTKNFKPNLSTDGNLINNNYKLINKESKSLEDKKYNKLLNLNNTEILFNSMKINDSSSKEKNLRRKKQNNELLIINTTENNKKNIKLSNMNKFKNIFLKKSDILSHKNKRNKINTIKRITNIKNSNTKIKNYYARSMVVDRSLTSKKRSLSSQKNFENRNKLRNSEMKISDIYRNNSKSKNKVKRVYIVGKNKYKNNNTNITK